MIHEKILIQVTEDQKSSGNEYQPYLVTYLLDNSVQIDPNRKRPAVVICPGGAYRFTSDREAEAIAIQINAMGYHALILRYSVAPARFPKALVELATAVSLVRNHAEEWNIDTDSIIVAGFSAGAHLACSLGMFWNRPFLKELMNRSPQDYRPNGMLLNYPVITSGEFAHRESFDNLLGENKELLELVSLEKQVSADTPPAFLWHTVSDELVPVENSLLLSSALQRCHIPFELHIYPNGIHGLSLANEETRDPDGGHIQEECQSWISLFHTWMKHLK